MENKSGWRTRVEGEHDPLTPMTENHISPTVKTKIEIDFVNTPVNTTEINRGSFFKTFLFLQNGQYAFSAIFLFEKNLFFWGIKNTKLQIV